jgi:hypothetical protein
MKFLRLTICLLSFLYVCIGCVHGAQAAISSGSVTQANMKMSIVNGTAFADFSAAGALTNYLGDKVVISDSAGKHLTGYIKATGTGETYGSELLANTAFDNTTGVSAFQGANASVAGGQSGNCLEATDTAGLGYTNSGEFYDTSSGALLKASAYLKKGTDDYVGLYLAQGDSPWGAYSYIVPWPVPTDWQQVSIYGTTDMTHVMTYFSIGYVQTAGLTGQFDTASTKQVLTPSATGATIVSTPGGSTYNWASEDSGFNRNDSSGYTYGIFSGTEFVSVVDPGGAGDYSSLAAWNNGVKTDLTVPTTQVFSGSKALAVGDNASVTLYRGGASQSVTGTVVHATASQILVESISNFAFAFQSGDQWRVDGSNYFTITNSADSAIAVATCRTTNGAADTTPVNITGWTTSPTNYIKIWTNPTENYRHAGKWDDTKYRLEVSSGSQYGTGIYSAVSNVRIDGLQVKLTTSAIQNFGIYFNVSGGEVQLSDNIVRGVLSSGADIDIGILFWHGSATSATYKVWNNIIYDFVLNGAGNNLGMDVDNGTAYAYNNTVANCAVGLNRDPTNSPVFIAKNNIFQGTVWGYSGTFDASSDYNISNFASDAPSPSYRSGLATTVTFIDSANKDFHLAFTDTGAKGYGTNLSQDANLAFSQDIDGQSRTGNWDIGADQTPGAEIQSNTQKVQSLTDGLVMYQSFDGPDISGTTAYDRSGNNNKGTISGATPVTGNWDRH